MALWPFKRQPPEPLTPEQLRDRLLAAAASGSRRKLLALCRQYQEQIVANADLLRSVPEGMRTDPVLVDRYVQSVGAAAQCLAQQCNAPELWNKLCGTADDNPLMQWDRWYGELAQRMARLEHIHLIAEAQSFLEQAKTLQGSAARLNEVFLLGRLAELRFHSGQVRDAIAPLEAAMKWCRENNDLDGQIAYQSSLLEVHRYLGDASAAASLAEQLIALHERQRKDARAIRKQLQRLRDGEPLCRIERLAPA